MLAGLKSQRLRAKKMAQSELRKRSAYFSDASELLVCGLCLYLVELVGVDGVQFKDGIACASRVGGRASYKPHFVS